LAQGSRTNRGRLRAIYFLIFAAEIKWLIQHSSSSTSKMSISVDDASPASRKSVLQQAQSSYVAFLNAKLARFSRPFCLAITISVCNLIFFVGMFAGLTGVCPVEKYSSLQIAPMGQIDWMQKAGTISCLQMVGYIYYDTRIGFAELTAQPHPDITKLGEQNGTYA